MVTSQISHRFGSPFWAAPIFRSSTAQTKHFRRHIRLHSLRRGQFEPLDVEGDDGEARRWEPPRPALIAAAGQSAPRVRPVGRLRQLRRVMYQSRTETSWTAILTGRPSTSTTRLRLCPLTFLSASQSVGPPLSVAFTDVVDHSRGRGLGEFRHWHPVSIMCRTALTTSRRSASLGRRRKVRFDQSLFLIRQIAFKPDLTACITSLGGLVRRYVRHSCQIQ